MQTISSTAATAPVLAFQAGATTFLHEGKIHHVASVGLVTGVGWTFRTSTGIVAPAHEFHAVSGGWIARDSSKGWVDRPAPGWRLVAWVSDEATEGGGYWVHSGKAFIAEEVTP